MACFSKTFDRFVPVVKKGNSNLTRNQRYHMRHEKNLQLSWGKRAELPREKQETYGAPSGETRRAVETCRLACSEIN